MNKSEKAGEKMKFKINSDEKLREMHKMYADGATGQEIKKWYASIPADDINEEETCPLTDDILENLKDHFQKAVECNSFENAEKIQIWFKTQPHLPQPSLGLIHKFLWASKEDPEQCKKMLNKFYTLRGTDDEIFGSRDTSSTEARQIYDCSYFASLPGFTPEFYRVTVSRLNDLNPDSFLPYQWVKRFFCLADLRVRDDFCLGDVMIFDLEGFTLHHLLKFPITLARRAAIAAEGALPTRIKQIHMVNSPSYIDKVVGLFKPFLKEKLAKRIYIHTNTWDELHKVIPKEILPAEYGGEAGPIKNFSDKWVKELEKNRDWFVQEEKKIKRIYLEAKKAGKLFMDSGDLFGVEGSFKKLQVD